MGVEWCQEAGDCAEWIGAEPCTDKLFVIKIDIVCCKECRFWSLVIFPSLHDGKSSNNLKQNYTFLK